MKQALEKFIILMTLASTPIIGLSANHTVKKPLALAKSAVHAAGDTAASIYPATSVGMRLVKVAEHVYYAQGQAGTATDNEGFISNAGVVVTDEGVVLFDTLGTPSLGQLLLQKIREITDKPITKVIISHYHTDHVYGLQVFKDLGAEVIAGKGVEQYLQSDEATNRLEERKVSLKPWVNQFTRVIPPDRTIDGQSELTLGGVRFTLSAIGMNHSHGDLTMRVSPDNVLFVGDLVFEQRLPFVATGNSKKWLKTLNTMKLHDVAVLIPGHGAASMQPLKALGATRSYLAYLRSSMQKAVDNMIPFDEAYNIDWSEYRKLPAFNKANRGNAYSVYLSLEADSMDGN